MHSGPPGYRSRTGVSRVGLKVYYSKVYGARVWGVGRNLESVSSLANIPLGLRP